jgi:hypothetical protein
VVLGEGETDHEVPFHASISVVDVVDPLAKPSAMQNETERQDTAQSSSSAPEGFADGITVQVVPFHTLIKVDVTDPLPPFPTAAQNDDPTQDTPLRTPEVTPAGSGLARRVHEVPSQCSMRESALLAGVYDPAAMQLVLETQDTERNCELLPGAVAVGPLVQVAPFHCSTRSPVPAKPTARQYEVETHDTPWSSTDSEVDGDGAGTMDQLDPFHCSIRGWF